MLLHGRFKLYILISVAILFCLVLPANVNAIGITPGRVTINFEPNLEKELSFTVINNEHKDMSVLLYVGSGPLNNTVTLYNKIVKFSSADESKTFRYKLTLPERIETPGAHRVEIFAMELPSDITEPGAFVGATTAVVHQIKILVPYPGKYATAELSVKEAGKGEPVQFYVKIFNLGKSDILKAGATIDILGPTNEKIATVKTNEISIEQKKKGEVMATWIADVNPGVYHAVATVDYDGNIATDEKNFAVGTMTIKLLDVKVNEFTLGDIAKFNVLIQSEWNKKITGVNAELIIYDENNDVMADVKSASADIEPMQKTTLFVYWDTSGVREGVYDSVLRINYADRTTENKLKNYVRRNSIKTEIIGVTAKVVEEEGGLESQITTLLYIIIILVGINIMWLYKSRKGKQRK